MDVRTGYGEWVETYGQPVVAAMDIPLSEHVTTALDSGWVLADMREQLIDDSWIALKLRWEPFRNHPITVALAWRKPQSSS